MSALNFIALGPSVRTLPRLSLEAVRRWSTRRRMHRVERLAARQFAGMSPHMRADIGVPAVEQDRSDCLRHWTGGVT